MPWLAPWGSPRNTRSSPAQAAASYGVNTRSGYAAARLGYSAATAVPACVSPVASTTCRSGWPAARRSSSAPVNPEAPMMPTRAMR